MSILEQIELWFATTGAKYADQEVRELLNDATEEIIHLQKRVKTLEFGGEMILDISGDTQATVKWAWNRAKEPKAENTEQQRVIDAQYRDVEELKAEVARLRGEVKSLTEQKNKAWDVAYKNAGLADLRTVEVQKLQAEVTRLREQRDIAFKALEASNAEVARLRNTDTYRKCKSLIKERDEAQEHYEDAIRANTEAVVSRDNAREAARKLWREHARKYKVQEYLDDYPWLEDNNTPPERQTCQHPINQRVRQTVVVDGHKAAYKEHCNVCGHRFDPVYLKPYDHPQDVSQDECS